MEQLLHILLGLGHRQPLLRHIAGSRLLGGGVVQFQKGPGVALGAAVLSQDRQGGRGEPQQPQLIGHGGLGLAHPFGGLLLGEPVGLNERGQGGGLLHKVQVPALQIFHQGQQGGLLPVHTDNDAGHLGEPRQLGGPQTAFSRYQLQPGACPAHRQGLKHPVLLNAGRQFLQPVLGKDLSGLGRIGGDGGNGHKLDPVAFKQALST